MSTIIPSRVKPEDEELAKKRLELAKLESELALSISASILQFSIGSATKLTHPDS